MTLRYKTPFLLSVTKAGSVKNALKPVILSSPLGEYRRVKNTTHVILSDASALYRRMKPTMTLRYKTSFLLSVTSRLLRLNSFLRNLAMTMCHPEFGFSQVSKDETHNRTSIRNSVFTQ
jgi:hypothetical protein